MPTMYQAVKRTREEYRDLQVAVDPVYKINVTNRVYPKACFNKSWDYIIHSLSQSKIKLIHGTCMVLGGIPIDHGWIEIGENIVFEGVYQRFYDKEKYYAARGLIKHFEYSSEQVRDLSWKHKHKGPWENIRGGNCFDLFMS